MELKQEFERKLDEARLKSATEGTANSAKLPRLAVTKLPSYQGTHLDW